MTNEEFVLSQDQRDEIMKAPSLWVIGTNLTIIHASLPRANSN
jgi:hypothetical protein